MYAILGRAATHEDSANASWLVITDDDTLLRYDIFGAVVNRATIRVLIFVGLKFSWNSLSMKNYQILYALH